MANFPQALLKTLSVEGVVFGPDAQPVPGRTGYGDHPKDPGGETNYGITRRRALEYGYSGPMSTIPYWKVLQVYKERYWDFICGDQMPDQGVAEEVFDSAVNCGQHRAVRWLQRALNKLNNNQSLYLNIEDDGICGPKTIHTLGMALAVKSWYREVILIMLNSQQCIRYMKIATKNEEFEVFEAGLVRNRCKMPGSM